MNTHDDKDGSLSVALTELADTMPEDPNRVEGIHARARRLRTRRRATRTAAGLVVGAATIAGIIAIRPGPTAVSTFPASEPAPPGLPSCRSVTPPDLTAVDPSTSADAAVDSKAAAAGVVPSDAGSVTGIEGVKGFGTVAAASDTSVTITLEGQQPGQPAEVTAGFTSDTAYYDGGTQVTERPAANPGDRVAFGAVLTATGGYELLLLEAHPADQTTPPATGDVTDAKKAAAAANADATTVGADAAYVKQMAEIVSVQPDSLTLNLRDGQLAGQVVTAPLAPDVIYTSGDQKCVDPALAPGDVVGVLLLHGDGDTYTVQKLALFHKPGG
jgi:hypothetical protein